MSKTDKTAPYNVKLLYYPSWVIEVHDHRNGICELPEKPTPSNINDYQALYLYNGEWVDEYPFNRREWKTNPSLPSCMTCHYGASRRSWGSHLLRCGCPVCQDTCGRKRETRSERLTAKRYSRGGWRKEY
jgi:hypothetical protein